MASQLPVKLHLDSTHVPAVLDLEGTVPCDILLQVRRGGDLTRSMNILTDGSLFDIPYAFSKGLLRLIDLGSKEQVDLGFVGTSLKPTANPRIITLPPRTSRLRLFEHDLVIPLRLNAHIKPALVPDHEYRVELGTLELGIKWWNYGDDVDLELRASNSSLPPSEPAKLVAMKSAHRDFAVVNSLPKPPSISISMSLSSSILHRSKSPPTTLRVVITNKGDRTITLKSSGHQVFIRPSSEDTPDNHRITSINPSPSIDNLSITKISTSEEFIAKPTNRATSLTLGSGGNPRRGLTTLEPEIPLTHEFVLLENAEAIVQRMGDDDEFRLRLRPFGVWWFAGTFDDIFDDQKTIKKLPGPCLPLVLQSDDELQFRLED
ncbi:hypothetical protein N7G274_002769 [Stereocaulon virgatum]|uniref:Uncharacterized protein n=1 Tax=Stereocaulon virgatum TaxID=373712 RepID=A0ABR4AHK1_9LECA